MKLALPEEIGQDIIEFLLRGSASGKNSFPRLSEHTDLQHDLGMDSMDIAELIVHLERKYQLDFNRVDNIPDLKTIGGIAHFTFAVAADQVC